MKAVVTERGENGITISVFIPFGRSMPESETDILTSVNSVGQVSTSEALSIFDTDGDPISVCGVRMTSKDVLPKEYQTPFGVLSQT